MISEKMEYELERKGLRTREHSFAGYVGEIGKERIRPLDIFFEESLEPVEVFTYRNGEYISYKV